MSFKYFDGFKNKTNETRLLNIFDNYESSYLEIIKNKHKFGSHFNDEHYINHGPLRDCKSVFLTENIKPKFLGDQQNININKDVAMVFPETLKLYFSLISFLKKENNHRARAYVTILPSGKIILPHSDTGAAYFSKIERYQFYYNGNENIKQIINKELFPVKAGYFYFFDHQQMHEYHNSSDDDLILMVFDLYK